MPLALHVRGGVHPGVAGVWPPLHRKALGRVEVRGTKAANLFASCLVLILIAVLGPIAIASTSEPFVQSLPAAADAKRAKKTPAAVQVSLIYPANGVLAPNQPQMIQLGVTVQPKSGTQLNKYRLRLRVLKTNGKKVIADSIQPTQTSLVTTLNMGAVAPGEYELAAELVQSGTKAKAPQRIRIRKTQDPVATPTPTATPTTTSSTPTATATATSTSTATTTVTASRTPTPTPTASVTASTTATATATATATRTATSTATATASATTTGKATATTTRTATALRHQYSDPDPNCHGDCFCIADGDRNGYSNRNSHSDRNGHGYSDREGYPDGDCVCHQNSDPDPNCHGNCFCIADDDRDGYSDRNSFSHGNFDGYARRPHPQLVALLLPQRARRRPQQRLTLRPRLPLQRRRRP